MGATNIDIGTAAFAVYKGSTELLGMSEVTLPDIEYLTSVVTGAGIAGEFEETFRGFIKQMTVGFNFKNVTKEAIVLAEPTPHTLELRAAAQEYNPVSGEVEMKSIKHVMRVMPKKTSAGKLTSASAADASGEYSVRYWKLTKAGKVLLEIDPLNFICIINGVDYLKDIRSALGK